MLDRIGYNRYVTELIDNPHFPPRCPLPVLTTHAFVDSYMLRQ